MVHYTRSIPNYTPKELRKINIDKERFAYDYDDMEIKEYSDREEDIKNIMEIISDKKTIKVMIVSRTQSGKTYVLLQVIKKIVESGEVPLDNIFIITGLNSVDWKEQTKERIPNCCWENILHLKDISNKSFVESLKKKKNVRIIIDETQIACADKQTLHSQFDRIGLRDYKYLYEKNIQIIETSATPAGTLVDMLDNNVNDECPESNKIYTLSKTQNYFGIEEGLMDGTLKQSISLYQPTISSILDKSNSVYKQTYATTDDLYSPEDKDDIQDFITGITDEYHYNSVEYTDENFKNKINTLDCGFMPQQVNNFLEYYRDNIQITNMLREIKYYADNFGKNSYIFIRTPTGGKQDRVLEILQKQFPKEIYDYEYYDQQHTSFKLENLKVEPKKTTFVLIKEKCRCSQTLHKEYISVGYERLPQRITTDDPQAQGLYARIKTGYDVNPKSVCYCNIESCEALLKTEANGYDMTGFKSASLDTKGRSKGTYNRDASAGDNKLSGPEIETMFEWGFKSVEEVNRYCKEKFGIDYKPTKGVLNQDGFYIKKWHCQDGVRTQEDIRDSMNKLGRLADRPFYSAPYYTDVTDNTSLLWSLCWKIDENKEPLTREVTEIPERPKQSGDKTECKICNCFVKNINTHYKTLKHIRNQGRV